jgi:4-amino-4-deoxy-L-arabinose transferase-like glycosyltransferase
MVEGDRLSRLNTPVVALLLTYLVIASLYTVRTPDWQAPDEPAHYNYIAQIVSDGCCPVIEVGDWDQAYLEQLTASEFAPDQLDQLDTLQYEDHQPPLYYLLSSVVYRFTNGSLLALRLFSVVIGLGVVVVAHAVARILLSPPLALTAAAFVVFVPQHLAMLAAVNNDGLSELVIGLTLLATLHYLRGSAKSTWVLGIWVAIALLTKMNTAFLVGIIPLMIVLRWWTHRAKISTTQVMRSLFLFFLPILLLAGIWWARNLSIYGTPDFFGLGRHDLVVAEQPRTADQIAAVGFGEYLRSSLERTFVSFWGQFGWMALPINDWLLWLVIGFSLIVASGWLIGWFIRRSPPAANNGDWRGLAWTLLSLTVIAVFVQYVYYNTEFYQMQGRYLFPMLIPLGIYVALGLDGWRRLVFERSEQWQWATLVPVLVLIPLNLYIVWRVIPLLASGN